MAGCVPPGQRHGVQSMLRESKNGPQGVHRKWRQGRTFGLPFLLDEFFDPRLPKSTTARRRFATNGRVESCVANHERVPARRLSRNGPYCTDNALTCFEINSYRFRPFEICRSYLPGKGCRASLSEGIFRAKKLAKLHGAWRLAIRARRSSTIVKVSLR